MAPQFVQKSSLGTNLAPQFLQNILPAALLLEGSELLLNEGSLLGLLSFPLLLLFLELDPPAPLYFNEPMNAPNTPPIAAPSNAAEAVAARYGRSVNPEEISSINDDKSNGMGIRFPSNARAR